MPFQLEGDRSEVDLALAFATALFLGALIGIDRERKQRVEGEASIGGLRTFILIALVGAMAAWLAQTLESPWLFGLIGLGVAAVIVAGYVMQVVQTRTSPGLTTEVAALATYLLGGVALFGRPDVAVAIAIAITAALAWKHPLHGFVGRIETHELYAALQLLIATFIVLPILPNRTLDPWGALNPREIWVLVILISALSLSGYIASRWLGPRRGILLTALFGGLVSSTAVTLALARRSREESAESHGALATGLVLAWTVMFARVVVETAIVHPPLVSRVGFEMGAMGLVAGGCAWWSYRAREHGAPAGESLVPLANPFRLAAAIRFAALFAAVLLAVALLREYLPAGGLYLAAAVAGLTDVDAITLSVSRQAREGLDPEAAAGAIALAAASNTLAKFVLVSVLGAPTLRRRIGWATFAILVAGALAVWFARR